MMKKKRKLTEEQKDQRRELLAKARESKAPPKYVTVAPAVRELPDDHGLSLKKVRGWIKNNKDERNRLKKILRRSFDNQVNRRFQIVDKRTEGVWYDDIGCVYKSKEWA